MSRSKTVNINHVVQVKNESSHIGYCQEFHGKEYSEKCNKEKNYIIAQMKRRIRNILKHLNHQYKQIVRVKKRVTVTKFRRCFVLEHQDYWMYKDLSEDDVKFAKEIYI